MGCFRRIVFVSLVLGCASLFAHAKGQPVPDEDAAVRAAERVLVPIYGQKQIESEKPFKVSLNGNTWIVCGHLQPGWVGGVAQVKIDKRNGRILSVTHGK